MAHDIQKFRKLDPALLVIFALIYDMGSVSGVAAELKMSQSGISTALLRLREQLNDPLFIKSARGMEPTSRARMLIEPIRAVISTIEREVLSTSVFDPKQSDRVFTLALSDIGEGIYLPLAIQALQRCAPNVSLKSVFMRPKDLEVQMAKGSVDVALGFFPDIKGNLFFQKRIGLHSFACIARRGHPFKSDTLTMMQFETVDQIVVSPDGRGQEVFESFLKFSGIKRKIVLQTPHFMSLPIIVANTDAIAVVPQALADFFSSFPEIREIKLPFLPPTFQVNMYWHRSMSSDPSNIWLREMLSARFNEIRKRAYHRNGDGKLFT